MYYGFILVWRSEYEGRFTFTSILLCIKLGFYFETIEVTLSDQLLATYGFAQVVGRDHGIFDGWSTKREGHQGHVRGRKGAHSADHALQISFLVG